MPWPKAILDEFGLWPVWMPQGAATAAAADEAMEVSMAAAVMTDGDGDVAVAERVEVQRVARADTVPQAAPRAPDVQGDHAEDGLDAFGEPMGGRRAAPGVAPAARESQRREAVPMAQGRGESRNGGRHDAQDVGNDMPVWIADADDAAADAALWSIMQDAEGDAPAAPALPGVETLDWNGLAERVAGCTACGLCKSRTQTVFGVGDQQADWLLVGEAPGQQEDLKGEPFVGQAGKLLDNMLGASTLKRGENVYIAHVLKCRPPNNRDPEPAEVESCEPFLKRQVALLKPRVIVVMGRFAAQSILRTQASIASLRGKVHEYEGVPVIVTYHPAYLLRSLPDKAKAWTDWCLARATYESLCETTPGKAIEN